MSPNQMVSSFWVAVMFPDANSGCLSRISPDSILGGFNLALRPSSHRVTQPGEAVTFSISKPPQRSLIVDMRFRRLTPWAVPVVLLPGNMDASPIDNRRFVAFFPVWGNSFDSLVDGFTRTSDRQTINLLLTTNSSPHPPSKLTGH